MKSYLKLIIVILVRQLLKLGYIFPVKKRKVLFSAYEGRQYTCNPKYVFEEMVERFGNEYEHVWVLNNRDHLPMRYLRFTKTVRFLSISHIYHFITSGVIISNLGIEPVFPKRKKQKFINTWHGGGAYKRVSFDMELYSTAEKCYMKKIRDIRSRNTDYFLSSCRRFTEVLSRDLNIPPEVFTATGMPRNDRLVNSDAATDVVARARFCGRFDIPEDNLLVLYAPTFRGTFRKQHYIENRVCCLDVKQAFEARFGRPVTFMVRSHLSYDDVRMGEGTDSPAVIDVTDIPDMQDLLEVADVLITDYSSSIWDFGITLKPGFLFVPDLSEYRHYCGFVTPIDRWPYPYACTVAELCQIIKEYSEAIALRRIRAHQKELSTYEGGNAVDSVINLIGGRSVGGLMATTS